MQLILSKVNDMMFKGAPLGSLGESDKAGGLGKAASGFVASKWETVDPEEVKKGVVTTSKWETEEKDEKMEEAQTLSTELGDLESKYEKLSEDLTSARNDVKVAKKAKRRGKLK